MKPRQHILDDLALLADSGNQVEVSISLPSDRPGVLRVLGERNPSPTTRLRAARPLTTAGIPTRINVAPLQPHSPAFAELLADSAHIVWVDWAQHTSGFRDLYRAHGWRPSTRAEVEAFADELRDRMGADRVRVGAAQFRHPRWSSRPALLPLFGSTS